MLRGDTARMGHAHWLVLRKPLIPSSTEHSSLSTAPSIVGSYVWEGQPSKSNDAEDRSRVSLKFLSYMSSYGWGAIIIFFKNTYYLLWLRMHILDD